jgi:tripeptidyl-peptidase-1
VTCPFVTAVGATQINPGSTVNDPESASAQVIFSGGGFSDIYRERLSIKTRSSQLTAPPLAMPQYQRAQVKEFFKNHNPPYSAEQYNNSMRTRGYPDISANGANYVIAIDGEFGLVFGTSASTPVVASMVCLLHCRSDGDLFNPLQTRRSL